jgi:MFS family permease
MFLPILLLAAAGFTVLTTEFLIIGLLPGIARDLHVSVSQAGLLVTLFAFTVACCGPFLTAWCARFERKRLFVGVLLLFAASNGLAALATDYYVMAVARLVPALGLPVFWALASETAVDIVGPAYAGRAISKISFGVVCATVFGIPLGTLLGDALGWRPLPRWRCYRWPRRCCCGATCRTPHGRAKPPRCAGSSGCCAARCCRGMCCCRCWCSAACSRPTPTWRTCWSAWTW